MCLVLTDENDADELFHRIRKAVDESICKSGYEAVYTISAGIISSENTSVSGYKELMKYSQFALSEAKNAEKTERINFKWKITRNFYTEGKFFVPYERQFHWDIRDLNYIFSQL